MLRLSALLSAAALAVGCATKPDLTKAPPSATQDPAQPSVEEIREKMREAGIDVKKDEKGCLLITLPNGKTETNCGVRQEGPSP